MSTSIDQAFVKQFEREVHEAYQRQGSRLRHAVRVKNGVVGSSTVFQRVGISWVAQTNTPAITNVVRVAAGEAAPPNCAGCGPDLPYVIVERSTSPQLQVLRIDDFPSTTTVVTANTQGWSFAVRGGMMVLAYSLNGDVRLAVAPYISGGVVAFSDFGGPPRPGFPSPPVPLDLDVDALPPPSPDPDKLRPLFQRLQFTNLLADLAARVGATMQVLIDEAPALGRRGGVGRSYADAPEIDGRVRLLPPEKASKTLKVGEFTRARIIATEGHDLVGVAL